MPANFSSKSWQDRRRTFASQFCSALRRIYSQVCLSRRRLGSPASSFLQSRRSVKGPRAASVYLLAKISTLIITSTQWATTSTYIRNRKKTKNKAGIFRSLTKKRIQVRSQRQRSQRSSKRRNCHFKITMSSRSIGTVTYSNCSWNNSVAILELRLEWTARWSVVKSKMPQAMLNNSQKCWMKCARQRFHHSRLKDKD